MKKVINSLNLKNLKDENDDVAIIIPSRLNSVRLPQKPLTVIGKRAMIEHVLTSVSKTKLKHIYVATDAKLIASKVEALGYKFIMTDESCGTGTDRVFKAFRSLNDSNIKYIINVQGDMPFVDPQIILNVIKELKSTSYDIITPITKVSKDIAEAASNVKVVVDKNNKALYFSRSLIPFNAKGYLYHIGVYGFRAPALEKFVRLPRSFLEATENLEQLRALENGMSIGVTYADSVPISVDTKEDLNKAIEFHNEKNRA